MRALLVGFVALLVASGCDDAASTSGPAPTAEPPRQGLYVDHQATPTQPALAVGTLGESSLRIVLSDTPVTCKELEGAYPERPWMPGRRLDFWLRRPWTPDGEGAWEVRSAFVSEGDQHGHGCVLRGGLIAGVKETPDGFVIQDLDLAAQDREHLYQWAGDLAVKRCTPQARPETDRAQPDLKLTVAGRSVAVHGATVRPQDDKLVIRLTRAPHGCASAITEGYDFYLDLAVSGGESPKLLFGSLLGDAFPEEPSSSEGKETFTVAAEEDLHGTGEVAVALKGTLRIGTFPVTLDGKATLERCTPAGAIPSSAPSSSAAPALSAPSK